MDVSTPAGVVPLACPECGAPVPVEPGFSPWCDRCGWNIAPPRTPVPQTLFERFYASIARRGGAHLAAQIARQAHKGPRLTLTAIGAGLIAALVHATTLIFLIAGILLVTSPAAHLLVIGGGLLLLLIAWFFRPRPLMTPDGVLERDRFPALYQLVDEIADGLGTARPHGIVVDHRYNAGIARYGWRQRRILTLGLPLLKILDPQERVALVGHELAHARSRDLSRGRFIGSAVTTLQGWYELLQPSRLVHSPWGLEGIPTLPAHVFTRGLSLIPLAASYLLSLLLFRDSQRAEYRADLLAAGLSGTQAALRLLEKMHFSDLFEATANGLFINEANDAFGDFADAVERMPPRELARIRRIETIQGASLDTSHPPTVNRVQMLNANGPPTASVVLAASDSRRIDEEVQQIAARVRRELLDDVQERMDTGPEVEYGGLPEDVVLEVDPWH
jgi:Zn-dependent protease with chaperone function